MRNELCRGINHKSLFRKYSTVPISQCAVVVLCVSLLSMALADLVFVWSCSCVVCCENARLAQKYTNQIYAKPTPPTQPPSNNPPQQRACSLELAVHDTETCCPTTQHTYIVSAKLAYSMCVSRIER